MEIPIEFRGRVYQTKKGWMLKNTKLLSEIQNSWPGSELDVIYEKLEPRIVIVFESTEDCLAFKLKYGEDYV